MLTIDGAYGEGGGQILRTALALSVLLQQPVTIENIRAGRKNPGLAAQHLTAVHAAAALCDASLSGDHLESTRLTFQPRHAPSPGEYHFDVAQARSGGSAGAATLVLQTVLLPLAFASGESRVTVKGGTHVPWSPPFHYLDQVYRPALARMGIHCRLTLRAWGWYPAGGGEIEAVIAGGAPWPLPPLDLPESRGPLREVVGLAVASSLPAHIAQRIAARAFNLLRQAGLPARIEPVRTRSVSPGAGIFLTADYGAVQAGFSALGRRGKPSEQVAAEAVEALLAFHRRQALVDMHLADQLILPLALTDRPARLPVDTITHHTLTNIWVVEQFLGPRFRVNREAGQIDYLPEKG